MSDESESNKSKSNESKSNESKPGKIKSNERPKPKYFRRLALSDGTFAYPICCIKLDWIEPDSVSEFDLYSLLKISKYTLNVVRCRKMIVLLEFEPLTAGSQIGQFLGDPAPFIPDGSPMLRLVLFLVF